MPRAPPARRGDGSQTPVASSNSVQHPPFSLNDAIGHAALVWGSSVRRKALKPERRIPMRERPRRVRSCSSSPLDLTSGGPARGLHAPPGPNGLLQGRHVPPALFTPTSSSYPACRFLFSLSAHKEFAVEPIVSLSVHGRIETTMGFTRKGISTVARRRPYRQACPAAHALRVREWARGPARARGTPEFLSRRGNTS